jgi:lysophospholipase L1-like esterase
MANIDFKNTNGYCLKVKLLYFSAMIKFSLKPCFILFFALLLSNKAFMQNIPLSYLALGDSYTIGEQVPEKENFPNQVVALLKKKKIKFQEPAIIAKTGWTTDELQNQLAQTRLAIPFDLVTLLIGVNNQYRGRSSEEYAVQFEELLQQAIGYAGGKTNHVIVLSIPDWGATPFAEGRDRIKIAKEIDEFNAINKQIAEKYKVHYIDITPFTREASTDVSLLTGDKLHPSGKDYKRWAEKVVNVVVKEFN